MTKSLRWLLVAVLTGHGLIHLLGAAKGFGWAEVSQLTEPIDVAGGVLWLVAAILALIAAALLVVGAPTWWWAIALTAAAMSQIAIATSWHDARAGTIVNLILVCAAAYGFASEAPLTFHAEYRDRVNHALSDVDQSPAVVDESDLVDRPKWGSAR